VADHEAVEQFGEGQPVQAHDVGSPALGCHFRVTGLTSADSGRQAGVAADVRATRMGDRWVIDGSGTGRHGGAGPSIPMWRRPTQDSKKQHHVVLPGIGQ
jgi:hypothetical protein